jgi:uncharacterized integral membrane protein (TIGR00698 family)
MASGWARDGGGMRRRWGALLPGLALTAATGLLALGLAGLERHFLGQQPLEPLVLALLLGMSLRTFLVVPARAEPGIAFAAKQILEGAIVLLGATLNLRAITAAGVPLFLCVLVGVPLAIGTSILLGRRLALSTRLTVLIAVGNAVCGNSAIAAVAPAIRAKKQEVASAVALTAILGAGVALALPLLGAALGLGEYRYGILAGMVVYAVPQVLVATLPVGAQAAAIAAVVKLTRVLLLGPIVAVFALLFRDSGDQPTRFAARRFVPWFVVGFLLLAALRTIGVVGADVGATAGGLSRTLTILAMAGLGLGVDLRAIRTVGPRVACAVVGSLALLAAFSLACIALFRLGA